MNLFSKILEFDDSLVTDIILYENSNFVDEEGLLNTNIERKSVNPIFSINLNKK